MGKRKQPFGYKMKLGEIVPQPQEAETVRSIYLQYLAGVSFKQLAEQLQTEDVPYDEDKSWNKNMVARILEDDRYIGEKEFPALIPTEQFHAAQERRKEMRPEYILSIRREQEQISRRIHAAASAMTAVAVGITEWDDGVVYQMLEKVTVLADNRIKVTFRNGVEIEQTVDQPKRRKFA